MEFWASSESDAASYAAIEEVRTAIEPALQDLLSRSHFGAAKLLLRYVPIVMPPELLDCYPPRTIALVEQRILDCAPQLKCEPFIRGSFADQIGEYVKGIRTASRLLPEFGFSLSDVQDFQALLSSATDSCTR